MGATAGGIDMITGRTAGSPEPREEYEDWLMRMVVIHGIGNDVSADTLDKEAQSKLQAARGIKHIHTKNNVYRFTPKAQRYLQILNDYGRVVDTSNEENE